MSLDNDMDKAREAVDKLNRYSRGLPKGNIANPKYLELNRKANEAINKLPRGMRSRLVIENW